MKRKMLVVLIASVILIGSGGGLGLYFSQSKTDNIQSNYSLLWEDVPIDTFAISFTTQLEGMVIHIRPLAWDSPYLITAEWNFTYEIGWGISSLNVNFNTESVNDSLNIVLENFVNWNTDRVDIDTEFFTIYLNPRMIPLRFLSVANTTDLKAHFNNVTLSSFEVYNDFGDSWINFTDSRIVEKLQMTSDSGRIYVEMTRGALDGDVNIYTAQLDIFIDFWNPILAEGVEIDLIAPESVTLINWMQHTRWNHSIILNSVSKYSMDHDFFIPLNICTYDLYLNGDAGHYLDGVKQESFTDLSQAHIQSAEPLEGGDLIKCNFTSTNGRVRVFINTCFKPQRYCGSIPNFGLPAEKTIQGNVSLIQSDELLGDSIAELVIHNRATNVIPNISNISAPVPESLYYLTSEWDMTYLIGGGLGYGDIQVIIEYIVVSNTLEVYISLDYEVDAILPYFNPCDFNIAVDSSLSVVYLDERPPVYVPFPDISI
ncbi:MAG: hypothetical protein ACTSRK_17835 [Promethearchaeota archaeon]